MEKRWYALQTYVGFERHVKAVLLQKIRHRPQGESFGEILVPTEKVIELVRGKKRTVERCLFPGYILAEVALNEESWHLVHSVPKVIGFVGKDDHSTSLSNAEVQEIIDQMKAGMVSRPKFSFSIGQLVKVIEGPFQEFTGIIQAVKPERSRARVAVSVFGWQTPVELDFHQLEAA